MNYKTIILILFVLLITNACKKVKKEYYPNGKLKKEYQYNKDGLADGYYKKYYDNGDIFVKSAYKNGKLEGLGRTYYKNGQVEWEVNYINGKEEGNYKEYYKGGELKAEATFKDGKEVGVSKNYFKDGSLEKEYEVKNGILHGDYREYYPNGQLNVYAIYKDSIPVYYEDYDETGKFTEDYRLVSIAPNADTITLGEKFTAKIKIYGPLENKNVKIIVNCGGFSLNSEYFEPENGELVYKAIAKRFGKYRFQVNAFVDDSCFTGVVYVQILDKPEI